MNHSPLRQYVFICGCSRSGTTTLANLLRSHPKVALGRERYAERFRHRKPFDAGLFARDRFCHLLKDGDTHHKSLDPYYDDLYLRFDQCTHVGDKIPKIYEDYDIWRRAFPGAKFIFLLRNPIDVAQSFEHRMTLAKKNGGPWPPTRDYRQAVEEWNLSLCTTLHDLPLMDILLLEYESLYQDEALLTQLFSFINLTLVKEVYHYWQQQVSVRDQLEATRVLTLSSRQKRYIARNAHFNLYRELADHSCASLRDARSP